MLFILIQKIMTETVKKSQTEKQYVWAIMLAPNFKKIENPSLDEPLELPYAVLFNDVVPSTVKTVYVGKPFTDPSLSRQYYQDILDEFSHLFSPEKEVKEDAK